MVWKMRANKKFKYSDTQKRVCVCLCVHTGRLCVHTGGEVPSLPNSFFKENGVDFNFCLI